MEEGLPLDTSNYAAQNNTSCDAYNVDSVLQSPRSPGLDTVNNSSLEIDLQGESQGPHSPLLDTNFERNSSLAINLLNQTHSEEPLTNLTGRYLLKIKEENRLTQTTTQRVAQATSDLFSATFRRLKRKIEQTLENADIKEVPGLEAVFDEFIFPYEDLQTKWMTGEFQRDKMSYVVISRLIILSFIDIDIREL